MRIAYLDCFSGISGDMLLGAMVDAGVPLDVLEQAAAGLNVGAQLEARKVVRGGITGTKVNVLTGESGNSHSHGAHEHAPAHAHSHGHSHDHAHSHGHDHAHEPEHTHGHHRSLST